MQTPLQEALVLTVVLLNAYCFGANCVERFVNYQTWHLSPSIISRHITERNNLSYKPSW